MSAILQQADASGQKSPTKAESAHATAASAWEANREWQEKLEALIADTSRSRQARINADEVVAGRKEQRVAAEEAVEPARLAIGAAKSEGHDTKPFFEELRSKEEAAYLARYEHEEAVRAAEKAGAAASDNISQKVLARSMIASTLKRALDAEKLACFYALVELGESFDIRVRDLACLPALELFRRQGTAAILGHQIPRA